MNALVPATSMTFAEIERLGVSIARSQLFGIKTQEQAIVLMAIAQAEGRHPALAARDYDVIQGRPAKKAEAMLRDFFDAGGKVQWHNLNDTVADCTFSHAQGGSVRVVWDMERAKRAGLGGKDMWQKYPRQMLRSRCVSEGVRTVWPGATSGMYVPEEAATIEGIAEPSAPEVTAPTPPPELSLRDQINERVPLHPRRTIGQFLDELEGQMRECGNAMEVAELIGSDDVQRALKTFKNGHKNRLDGIIASGIGAHAEVQHEQAEDDHGGWPGPSPEDVRREREAAAVA